MTARDRGSVGLRRGEVAAAAGVSIETLRYYERRGILAEPPRTIGGHRLYPVEVVTVLRIVKAAQRLGFTLDEVAELLDLGLRRRGRRTGARLHVRLSEKVVEVDERITDLMTIRDTLTAALDVGCDDLRACAEAESCPLPFEGISSR